MRRVFINFAVFLSIFLFAANTVDAQIRRPGVTLGGYAVYATPKGGFEKTYNFGAGGEVFGGIGLGKTFIIATAGLSKYKARSDSHTGMLTYAPVKIGVRQYI